MSYVLHIWEQPLGSAYPRNLEEAVAWTGHLHQQSPGQNPKFIEFARRITARYIDLAAPEADDMDPDQLAWTDGPIDGITDGAAYGIGIATGDLFYDVRSFVIDTARSLGLNVEDDQAGEFHYANGMVQMLKERVPARDEQHLGRASADLVPMEALLELICLRLAPMLKRHGYTLRPEPPPAGNEKYIERAFRAASPTGWHQLEITAFDRRPGYMGFIIDAISCCRAVSDLQRRHHYGLAPDAPLPAYTPDPRHDRGENGDVSTTMLRQYTWLTDEAGLLATDDCRYVLLSMADLAPAIAHLSTQIQTRLLPLLRCYDSITALDAMCNGAFSLNPKAPGLRSSVFFTGYYRYSLHHLYIAWLAGNPNFNAMCDAYLDGITKEGRSVFAGADDEVRDVVAYLRKYRRG
jgi:hypothetical protein